MADSVSFKKVKDLEKIVGKIGAYRPYYKASLKQALNLLHCALRIGDEDLLEKYFRTIPVSQRFSAAHVLDKKEGTPLVHAVICDRPEAIKKILPYLTQEEIKKALLMRYRDRQSTLMHLAATSCINKEAYESTILFLLGLLSAEDRLEVLLARDRTGATILESIKVTPELISGILSDFSEADRVSLIGARYHNRREFIHTLKRKPQVLKVVLELIPNANPFGLFFTGNKGDHFIIPPLDEGFEENKNYLKSREHILSYLFHDEEDVWLAYRTMRAKLNKHDDMELLYFYLPAIVAADPSGPSRQLKRGFGWRTPGYVEAMNSLSLAKQQIVAAVLLEERRLVDYELPGTNTRLTPQPSNFYFIWECLSGLAGISLLIVGLIVAKPLLITAGMGIALVVSTETLLRKSGFFSRNTSLISDAERPDTSLNTPQSMRL